jgi:polyhydroxybutyrate depolymerase
MACREQRQQPTTSSAVVTAPLPSTTTSTTTPGTPTKVDAGPLVAARPYRLEVPDGTDGRALPLVILLHGYGSSGANHDAYLGLSKATNARGVLLAIPDGTRDHTGKLFWNATEACCDFDGARVDDVAYLDAIVDDVSLKQRVDPTRVYIIGHSNGAFMAHRYACERSDRVAAIVALAGVPWVDTSKCKGHGVSVLQVHGDADRIIEYDGGKSFGNGAPYPGAEATVAMWAARDGCSKTRHEAGSPIDLDQGVPGAETVREAYTCGGAGEVDVELWRMRGSEHVPRFGARFAAAALDFLLRFKR